MFGGYSVQSCPQCSASRVMLRMLWLPQHLTPSLVCVWCAHIPHYMKWHKTRNYRENFGSFAMANPFRAKTFILCVFLFLIFFVFTLKTVCCWVAFNFAWWVFFVCSQRSLSTWCRWRYRSIIYFDGGIVLLLVGSFVRWPSARMECNYWDTCRADGEGT